MRWRARPLGCLVAAAIFLVFGAGIAGLVVWGSVIGDGGGPLSAAGFGGGSGMSDAPDRRTGGSVEPVPTWLVTDEGAVSFTVILRNHSRTPVRLTGVERDEDGDDHQFVPESIEPVTLGAGDAKPVTVRGRAVCEARFGGQITGKNGQTFVLGERGTQNVDLGALIEFDPCR